MGFCKRLAALLCIALLTMIAAPALAEDGEYYGSYPPDDIYVVQSRAHTCTLVAATMMLRNYICQMGSAYIQVESDSVEHFAWTQEYGLAQNFSIGQVSVTCSADVHTSNDKKGYLIDALSKHPEGVVIYDTGAPHAIWLIGYDEETDIFYCADTITRNGGQTIPLAESIIRGETQEDKVNTIDKIWYVK